MLKVSQLSKSFAAQVLFEDAGFQLNRGDRVGVLGRNGTGKTTLFKLFTGEDYPDGGSIQYPKNYRVGHLDQHLKFTKGSALEETALGLPETHQLEIWRAEKMLDGLGFSREDRNKAPRDFSGGYQIRIQLAKVLLSEPDLLLLDEPTNYLDIPSIRWLTGYLLKWPTELMIISHDRHFLDRICTHSLLVHRKRLRLQAGPSRRLMDQIALEEDVHENTRVNMEKKRKKEEVFISKFRAKARQAGMVQSRIKTLEKRETLEKLEALPDLHFHFRTAPFEAKMMLSVHNLSFQYRKSEPLLQNFSMDIGQGERIAIIGKNGRGKSTLMRLLAGSLQPQGGNLKIHPLLKRGFYEQTQAGDLDPERTVVECIRQDAPDLPTQQIRSICGAMLFDGDKALKKVKVLSGGERSRVCLGKLLTQPSHLLLLDEPTNHLDPESCDALLEALKDFQGSVVMITHHEGLLGKFPRRLVVFQESGHSVFEGSYRQFLREVGWETEGRETGRLPKTGGLSKKGLENRGDSGEGDDHEAGKPRKPEVVNKKEQRRLRALEQQTRANRLKPIQLKIKQLEKGILECEQRLGQCEEDLQAASAEQDGQRIADLSKDLHEFTQERDGLYHELEVWMVKLEREQEGEL